MGLIMSNTKLFGLLEGYENFKKDIYPKQEKLLKELVEKGQSPEILMISCCDSRVNSAEIFSAKPGDLFMVRNIANLVPPCQLDDSYHGTSAAVEYAVTVLKVKMIIVMGHSYCGGVKAAFENKNNFAKLDKNTDQGFVHQWMDMIKEISADMEQSCHGLSKDEKLTKLEHKNVLLSLKNLRGYKFVQNAVDANELELVGAWFNLDKGVVHIANEKTEEFTPL